jgi:hypothetical protein
MARKLTGYWLFVIDVAQCHGITHAVHEMDRTDADQWWKEMSEEDRNEYISVAKNLHGKYGKRAKYHTSGINLFHWTPECRETPSKCQRHNTLGHVIHAQCVAYCGPEYSVDEYFRELNIHCPGKRY